VATGHGGDGDGREAVVRVGAGSDPAVVHLVDSRITTGIVEGLNSKIKTAMKQAYGFKSFEYLCTVIYLVAGKINIPLPTQC